jgi:hypothetical protein
MPGLANDHLAGREQLLTDLPLPRLSQHLAVNHRRQKHRTLAAGNLGLELAPMIPIHNQPLAPNPKSSGNARRQTVRDRQDEASPPAAGVGPKSA